MRSLKRQRGLGWFGLTFVFLTLAFVAICAIKVGPLYINQMTVAKAVHATASDPEMGQADAATIHASLQKRWDADYVDQLDPRDIKIRRTEQGRTLVYAYEARVNLFYNIFVVIAFDGSDPMVNSSNSPF